MAANVRAGLVQWSAVAFLVAACSSSSSTHVVGTDAGHCTPGTTETCLGPGQCAGAQICAVDGKSYGLCACAGAGGTSGGGAGGAAGASGGGGTAGADASAGSGGTAGSGGAAGTSGAAGAAGTAGSSGSSGASGGSAGASGSAGSGGAGGSSGSGGTAGTSGSGGTAGSSGSAGSGGSVADLECLLHPQRDAANPLVDGGRPSVLFDGTKFDMWFGKNGSIWHADATDGLAWAVASSPVLSPIPGFESVALHDPVVVKFQGTFYMYYIGNSNSSGAGDDLGLATSSDGLAWTRYGANPIATQSNFGGGTWSLSGLGGWAQSDGVHLFLDKSGFVCDTTIVHVKLADGVTPQLVGSTNLVSPAGSGWDYQLMRLLTPFAYSGGTAAYYFGGNNCSASVVAQIGLVTTTDGLTWTRAAATPALPVGIQTWESRYVAAGSIVVDAAGKRRLYYGGSSDGTTWQIGLAWLGTEQDGGLCAQ